MTRITRRLTRMEILTRTRQRATDPGPALLVVCPDDWSHEDQIAFAGEDAEAHATVVERYTSQRPGTATQLIVITQRPDGPQ